MRTILFTFALLAGCDPADSTSPIPIDAGDVDTASTPDAVAPDANGPPSCADVTCAGGWRCTPCDQGGVCSCAGEPLACALACD